MIIGLVGRARSGKDTAATFLKGYKIKRLAYPIKQACQILYNFTEDSVESSKKDVIDTRWNITPRSAMVHMTNSIHEFMGFDFFIHRLFETWDGTRIVIPDVRYETDIQEIHRRGGITIKIIRDGSSNHIFENGIDQLSTTFTIKNNGSIEEFKKAFRDCMALVPSYAEHPEV
jgi:dephospho-CoA kinase